MVIDVPKLIKRLWQVVRYYLQKRMDKDLDEWAKEITKDFTEADQILHP